MDYQKHYNTLIERGRNRILKGYSENHHIIPKCMNGSNDKENLVKLTPEEHYVAHQLLVKMYPNHSGLSFSAIAMAYSCKKHQQTSNKIYGWLREQHSKNMSGSGNSMFNHVYTKKTLQKQSKSKLGKKNGMFGRTGKDCPLFGRTGKDCPISIPILCTTNGIVYPGINEAARQLKLDPSAICKVLKGKLKQTKGYTFEYVNK